MTAVLVVIYYTLKVLIILEIHFMFSKCIFLLAAKVKGLPASRWHIEVTDEFLKMVDVLVDGPFIEELKDISLEWRGSSNQNLIRIGHERKGL